MSRTSMDQPDERFEDRGPDARVAESFVVRNVQGIVAVACAVLFGGGGAFTASGLSAKQDSTNEKLDKITIQMTELKGDMTASKDNSTKLEGLVMGLVGRVSALEQRESADHERLGEHERRINKVEGGK